MIRNLLTSALVSIAIASGSGACSSDDDATQSGGSHGGGTTGGSAGTSGTTGASASGATGAARGTGGSGGTAAGTTGSTGNRGATGSDGATTTTGNTGSGGVGSGGPSDGGTISSSDGGMDAGEGATAEAGAGPDGGSTGPDGSGTGRTGGDAGREGGTGAYHPCPTNGSPCKILPFGDSITRGVKSSDDAGYRSRLFQLIAAAKQKVTFTGSLTNGPTQVSGQAFPRMHEGHPGWTIDPGYNMISSSYSGISTLVPSPALDGNPNIILLHIGTNDLFARDTANMPTRLESLLDKIVQNAPSALIVLAQITPCNSASPAAYNSKIPAIVESHIAKGQHVIGVDMSKMPLTDLSSDGTHPNDQGYAYMANVWYAAIKDLLPM